MSKKNSYLIDKLRNRDLEIGRLDLRTKFRIDKFYSALESVNLPSSCNILEIGSGTGYRAAQIAKKFSESIVTGVDISEQLISISSKKYSRIKNLSFVHCGFDVFSKSSKQKYHLIYLRLVLQHVSNPVDVLKKIYSLLAPGGTLLIEDVDRGLTVFYPESIEWSQIYSEAIRSHIEHGGDPYIGRKMAAYLREAGFKKIDDLSYVHSGDSTFIRSWLELFAPSFFRNFSSQKQKKAELVLSKLKRESSKTDHYAFTQIWFQFKAIK